MSIMSIMSKSFAAFTTATLIAIATPAFAGNSFTANFSFSRTASVSDTYASFEKTAKAACKSDRLRAGGMGTKHKAEKICAENLMHKAVTASKYSPLIAYHNEQTGQQTVPSQYAQTN